MEKNKKTIDKIERLMHADLLSTEKNPRIQEFYHELADEYPNYTVFDLLNLCKIERFGELGWLDETGVEALKDLYQMSLELDREIIYSRIYRVKNQSLIHQEWLTQRKACIDRELETYGIKAAGYREKELRDSLDLLILDGGTYYNLCGERTKELAKELKNKKK